MEKLLEFAAHHWILVSALIAIIALLISSSLKDVIVGAGSISPIEATQMINHSNAVIIDVREDKEFAEGHIVNAIHIPLGSLNDRLKELDKYKSKHVIINCRSGHRSSGACNTLKKAGFENVFNLKGGVLAWQSANLPLTKN